RIILATDGDFNVGPKTDDELDEMIAVERESGIYLTCIGIGMGNYKDSKIQALAQRGNGNFAYIDSYAEAEKVLLTEFTKTLFSVADDAYLNVRFDPDFVKEYRVLGFDNKVGAIKDVEATVEGGEIGSGYSTVVAFEIVPTREAAELCEESEEFHPVQFQLQYKLPNSNKQLQLIEIPDIVFHSFSKLTPSYRFAGAVIMFGSLLRKSKFVKEVSWNDVLRLAQETADPNNFSQKEFISIVQHAKEIYGRKRKKEKDQ
ncbi:MAG TPA: YfbK domain-containing protein, partial [Flavisolibacter sp.]|nr:YfbK domain-containing protein [Flavisolibacter sp.]